MIHNLVALEVKIGERVYRLHCDVDSPLGELHDVISRMKGFIVQKIQDAEKDIQSASQSENNKDV